MEAQAHPVGEDEGRCVYHLGPWGEEATGALEPCEWPGEADPVHYGERQERGAHFSGPGDGEGGEEVVTRDGHVRDINTTRDDI